MKEMLGNGDIPDALDGRLQGYIKTLSRADRADMLDKLEDLYDLVDDGKIIKNAEYVD